MALFILKLDKNGFLDRLIISIPCPFRPLKNQQNEATDTLQSDCNFTLADIYSKLDELDEQNPPQFYFSQQATL